MSRRIHSSTTKNSLSRRKKGFTLLELMVAAFLFMMVALAAAGTLFQALRMLLRARYLDRAENVLRIAADQFQSAKLKNPGLLDTRDFFLPTPGGPTGEGMAWNSQMQTLTQVGAGDNLGTDYAVGSSTGLEIKLHTVGANDAEAPTATLTRYVEWMSIDSTTGATSFSAITSPGATSAGQLVRATFRIQFDFGGRTEVLKTVAIRNLNPTDK